MTRRSSLPLVGALVVSILGAGVTRSLVVGQRQQIEVKRGTPAAAAADLSNVNSFTLGLLLGGLRGPLVMALWASSESQKTERALEDFDTKVELIRLLQPEFDTVHLFQIWNKAYNISAQMVSVPNKYTTILDALQYGFDVNRQRPDNINILASVGGLYFDKFGGAAEKAYFSSRLQGETLAPQDRVRLIFPVEARVAAVRQARLAGATVAELNAFEADEEGKRLYLSLPKVVADAVRAAAKDAPFTYEPRPVPTGGRRDAAGRPTQHAALLDDRGMLLPQFTAPRPGQAQTSDAGVGSELPYLRAFEPFPYGVSPFALAYNYYKQCEWLQEHRDARHAQLSDRVIASRPPMSLMKWNEEEWYAAARAEIDLADRPHPTEDALLATVTQDLVLNADLPAGRLYDETCWRYENASRLAVRGVDEYEAHIKKYAEDELTYRSHVRDLTARSHLNAADGLYLRAMKATGDARRELASQAIAHYRRAANLYTRYLFRYFMDDTEGRKILPQDVRNLRRVEVDEDVRLPGDLFPRLRDEELAPALERMRRLHEASGYRLQNSVDFGEIYPYVQRCYARLRSLALVR